MAIDPLEELAALAYRPRAMFLDVYQREGGWTPAAGSWAEHDLAQSLFKDADDNTFLVNHPRSVASIHVRVGADYLAGIGPLILGGEILFAPFALARVAFEHSVRAVTLLDVKVPQPQRCARALLEDLVSADIERVAWKHFVGKGFVVPRSVWVWTA